MKAIFDCLVLSLTGLALASDGIALVDFILHPLAGDHTFNSPLCRAVVILLFTPITLLVGSWSCAVSLEMLSVPCLLSGLAR